jgi:hypothetical protein
MKTNDPDNILLEINRQRHMTLAYMMAENPRVLRFTRPEEPIREKTVEDDVDEGGKRKRETKTDKIIKTALDDFEFFHDKELRPYATVEREGHCETYSLRSKAFRSCLAGKYWSRFREGIGGQITQDAIGVLEGHAVHGGPCHQVSVRLAGQRGNIYIDLGNDRHEVVEVTAEDWRVLSGQNRVKFRRPPGMTHLPYPRTGGSTELLRRYVNLANPDDFKLLVAFMLGSLSPTGPYPVLALTGEQGSAKTTLMRVLKALADHGVASCRSMPDSTRDLAISAHNSWLLAFDNLSHLSAPMSDALCRLSTGGGFATRSLYSDDEEVMFDAMRPVILNGIVNMVHRHDLADRAIILNLAAIPEARRIPEKEFWADFEDDAPEILGALLDAVSSSLKNAPYVKMDSYPRMADFAVWVTAAELALGWTGGSFLKAYSVNRREVTSMTLDADLVGTAVKSFMEERNLSPWEGTASELLNILEERADDRTRKAKGWPHGANSLSGKLTRSATALRAEGVEVNIDRKSKQRTIRLEQVLEQVAEKIVTIVTDAKKDMQGFENKGDCRMTMLEKRIVTGSSSSPHDRHHPEVGDDVDDCRDDTSKRIVTDADKKCEGKSGTCKDDDDDDGHDDLSGSLFRKHATEQLDDDQLAALKEFEREARRNDDAKGDLER